MLLGIFILFSINIFLVCFFSKGKKSILPVLMYLNFLVLLSGFYIYYLKTGGLLIKNQNLIFGNKALNQYFINLPIGYNSLSGVIALGRLFFCLFFILFAIQKNYNANLFFKKRLYFYLIIIGLIVICFIFSVPAVLTFLVPYKYRTQEFIVKTIDIIMYTYLAAGLILHFIEYFNIHFDYIKNRQRLLVFSQILLSIQFLFFSKLEPITVFQNYSSIIYPSDFSPFIGGRIENFWVLVMSFCFISTLLNVIQNWRYYKVYYDRAKKELTISEKVDSASISSSILIHGLKNQLLVSEVLIKSLKDQLKKSENKDVPEELVKTVVQLDENQECIQKRLDILYKSFIQVKTKLVPTDAYSLRDTTLEKVKSKVNCPHIYWKIRKGTLLCDENLLSEALSNLICNAVEACENVPTPIIMVKLLFLRKNTVITVSDNGSGIPKELKGRVFHPFTTTKNSLTNWGMGLCYSKMIIEKHIGEISYISNKRGGTTFIITLSKYKGGK